MDDCILIHEDCLAALKKLETESVDMVLADLPYGTTACKWDSVIPLEPLWSALDRVCKPSATLVMFGSEPFSSALRSSNIKNFRYDWIWDKRIPSGMSYARFQPMRQHEVISVFYRGKPKYRPQKTKRDAPISHGGARRGFKCGGETTNNTGLRADKRTYEFKNPTTLLSFDKVRRGSLHPTQKPTDLLEYLISTYTDEGDWVLDPTMGSGSSGVAAKNLRRRFIGIERDAAYMQIAEKRIFMRLPLFDKQVSPKETKKDG